MTRHHMTPDGAVPFTAEEETARDVEEKTFANGNTKRNAMAEIHRLEATVTQRRIRAMTTDAGKQWMDELEKLISIERNKL